MKTFVAVFLWIFNVILYPDDLDILLHFQGFCNLVKLILKRTDYTDADEIFQIFSGSLKIRFQSFFQKFSVNTFSTFYPVGDLTDHSTLFLPGKFCIDHLQFCHKDINGCLAAETVVRIFDVACNGCCFFCCQSLNFRFHGIRNSVLPGFLSRIILLGIFLLLFLFGLCESFFHGFLFFTYFFL